MHIDRSDELWNRSPTGLHSIKRKAATRFHQKYSTHDDVPYQKSTNIDAREGSFASVHKVTTVNGQTFAVKQFTKIYKEGQKKAIERECELMGKCSYPNVIHLLELYQVSTDPTTIFLVMEPWA